MENHEAEKSVKLYLKLYDYLLSAKPSRWAFKAEYKEDKNLSKGSHSCSYKYNLGNLEVIIKEVSLFDLPLKSDFSDCTGSGYSLLIMKNGIIKEYFNEDPGSNNLNLRNLFSMIEERVHSTFSQANKSVKIKKP